jgi:hypothetical protein
MNNATVLTAANTAIDAANTAIANVFNTATNAVANTVLEQNSPTSSILQFLLFVAGVVAVTLGGYYLYMRWSAAPTMTDDMAPAPVPERQVWCFVGEDDTGRWCVRVPSESSCSADRAYTSQKECMSAPIAPLA